MANNYTDKRTFKDLLPQLRIGLYGGWDKKGGLVGACDAGNLVKHARKEMDRQVKNVGWEGAVGALDHEKYSAPSVVRLEGLSPETDESALNGGFNMATNLMEITPDTTNEIDIDTDIDEDDCEPNNNDEGGDDVSDLDDDES